MRSLGNGGSVEPVGTWREAGGGGVGGEGKGQVVGQAESEGKGQKSGDEIALGSGTIISCLGGGVEV